MSNATPTGYMQRMLNYYGMNGVRRLTPRQRRRLNHKVNHATAPFGKKAEA